MCKYEKHVGSEGGMRARKKIQAAKKQFFVISCLFMFRVIDFSISVAMFLSNDRDDCVCYIKMFIG